MAFALSQNNKVPDMESTVLETEKTEVSDVVKSSTVEDVELNNTNTKPEPLSWQTYAAILTLMFQYNSYLFTLSMPPAILAFINADLGPDSNYIWITVSWNLCAAVLVTTSGRIADIFGRRWFLITGACIGVIGAIVGATAKNIPTMIASGILFGIGGGFQEMCFSAVQELVPNRQRFFLLGCLEVSNMPAQFSALIAYAFVAHSSIGWRACYWWCFSWEVSSAILLFLFYHPPSFETKHQVDHKTKLQLLTELDYVGLVLFSAGCAIILMGINWGGSLHPWKSAACIAPIVIGGASLIALGFWEVYADLKYPILPPKLFRQWRSFTAVLAVVFVGGMLYYSNAVLWPRISTLLFVPADDLILRGLYANMSALAVMVAAIYCMAVMPWVGHEQWQLIGLACLQTAFIGGFSSLKIHEKGKAIAFLLIAGAAASSVNQIAFGMVSLGIEDQTDIGVAVGLVSTSRLLGGAVASAIYVAIYTNKFSEEIPGHIAHVAASTGFQGSTSALLAAAIKNTEAAYEAVPGITANIISACQLAVKYAYVDAFSLTYKVAIAFGGAAIIASLCTRNVEQKKKSNDRAVRLENE
ncbi:hypothetical protein Z517_01555 [Fonsecaea pedrosoi CBS 271.37]|uniref:Unplaced genomic scaffold supercont1.1, whole genome shotgun sequence n=1 Tax=Fonsecaea pedrosoi CBS 271.37 TaxID=1442368 RepID=A0A0D2H5L9_9EURO|nr:uncharacterized protein Z517_01555 [Fonsecaea pedrosoi CBS 271.37]KIW86160.1 hypothetical protein Z517_01555 [Fonsecaea pedrosoi CBS 271.37]